MQHKIRNRIPSLGETFDYWTVIDNTPYEIKGRQYGVKCICKCGQSKYVRISALISGRSKGCECRAFDKMREKRTYIGDISDTFWGRIIKSARVRNMDFTVSKEYAWDLFLKQNKKCALSGLDIVIEKSLNRKKGCSNISASLDRIDSALPYIENNIQWVHKDVNHIKQELKEDYFKQLCKLITIKNEQ